MTIPIAVLDASVLVPRWSRIVLQQLAEGPPPAFQPLWSEWIVAETWRVLTRSRVEQVLRSGQPVDWPGLEREANQMLRHFLRVITTIPLARRQPLPDAWPGLADQDDAPIWATAKLGGASFVVSHNTRHFPPLVDGRHAYEGIEYLTAVEFVEDVLGLDPIAVYGRPLPLAGIIRSGRR